MIIMKLKGGLGNQMFQYAFGRALSLDSGKKLVLDNSRFEKQRPNETPWPYALDSFHITAQVGLPPFQSKLLKVATKKRGLKKKIAGLLFPVTPIIENGLAYQEVPRDVLQHGAICFDGYWQSEKYFHHNRETLLRDFRLKEPLSVRSSELLEQINQTPSSIALHIRRGDYISNASANAVHGTCSPDYYHKAMQHLEDVTASPVFFIFSDDIEWAKANLASRSKMVFANYSTAVAAHEDLHLISQCQHQIIANSSFSWWGAWLNANPEKMVVVPACWFRDAGKDTRDLIPDNWLKF